MFSLGEEVQVQDLAKDLSRRQGEVYAGGIKSRTIGATVRVSQIGGIGNRGGVWMLRGYRSALARRGVSSGGAM
jgi:hypothetical protein